MVKKMDEIEKDIADWMEADHKKHTSGKTASIERKIKQFVTDMGYRKQGLKAFNEDSIRAFLGDRFAQCIREHGPVSRSGDESFKWAMPYVEDCIPYLKSEFAQPQQGVKESQVNFIHKVGCDGDSIRTLDLIYCPKCRNTLTLPSEFAQPEADELLKALSYARRFLNSIDCDVKYIDDLLAKRKKE